MKVLFLSKSTPIFGGVERWLADMVEQLAGFGCDCRVGLARGMVHHNPESYLAAYPDLKCVALDGTTGTPAGRRMAARRCIRQVQPDIVIPVMLADGLAAAAWSKPRQAFRIVYPVHEISQGIRHDFNHYGQWMDRIVFVDQSGVRAYANECLGLESRCRMVSCGVAGPRGGARKWQTPIVRLGFCGRIEQIPKRVLDLAGLCDALEQSGTAYRLDIAGTGTARPQLEAALAGRIKAGSVVMRGALPREELYRSFYPELDILVITSEWETGPLVAFEAMMNQCLVITSDYAGRKENGLLNNRENCLVFPIGDVNALASAVKWAVANPTDAAAIAKNGFAYVRRERAVETMGKRWMQLLEEVQSQPPILPKAGLPETVHGSSRLGQLGLPDWLAEGLRRLLRRHFRHASPGEEWPYYSGPSH